MEYGLAWPGRSEWHALGPHEWNGHQVKYEDDFIHRSRVQHPAIAVFVNKPAEADKNRPNAPVPANNHSANMVDKQSFHSFARHFRTLMPGTAGTMCNVLFKLYIF